jgi:acetyltransferase-like isoleucine patch superfamily enzyme
VSDLWWKIVSVLFFARRFRTFGPRTWIRSPMMIRGARQISIGSNTFIRDDVRLEIVNRPGLPPASISIGSRVTMEQGVHIAACDSIVIEDDVAFAARCTIVDTHHPVGAPGDGNRARVVSDDRSSVHIGRRVFLGANVAVLRNVTIGENSIVGANSVVTRDIPANCVAAGAPARVIRNIEES